MSLPPVSSLFATPEASLMEYVISMIRVRKEYASLVIHLSNLLPKNRHTAAMHEAMKSFTQATHAGKGRTFKLHDGDMVIIYQIGQKPLVQKGLERVRHLFAQDPFVAHQPENLFSTTYNLENDYEKFRSFAKYRLTSRQQRDRLLAETRAQVRKDHALKQATDTSSAITPSLLVTAQATLERADLASLVRRQAICRLSPGRNTPIPAFYEVFISIDDLRQTILPRTNLFGNPALFYHLTETLDRRILVFLSDRSDKTLEKNISININVSSILSPDFVKFDRNLTQDVRSSIILEVNILDIFLDIERYHFARDFVQQSGYRLCLDGINSTMLPFIHRRALGANNVKLMCSDNILEHKDLVTQWVKAQDPTTVILSRCDTIQSVEFAHSLGISLCQGYYIEELLKQKKGR